MEKERLKQIGRFLNDRLIVHRNVENDTPWTTEEKMIKELYDSYLDLLIENNKQKEIIDKAIEFLKTEHNTYPSAKEWRSALIKILEDKEV